MLKTLESSAHDENAAHEHFMRLALAVARTGLDRGELPIGAIVVLNGQIIASAHTQEVEQNRLLVHADLLALEATDIQPMKQRLERLGVEMRPDRSHMAGEGQSFYFNDPDGHLLKFHTGDLVDRLQAYRGAVTNIVHYHMD